MKISRQALAASILGGLAVTSLATGVLAGDVLIINGATQTSEPTTTADITANLSSRHTQQGNTVVVSDAVPGTFDEFEQIWDIRFSNSLPITPSERTQFLGFLQGGNSMFVMGENAAFPTRNNSVIALVQAAGGGTLTFATPLSTQTVNPPATGPTPIPGNTVTYNGPGAVTNPGTGVCLTSDANSVCTAIAFIAGTLANAPLGSLTVVFDVNFMQALEIQAGTNMPLFIQNLVAFVTDQEAPAEPMPLPTLAVGGTYNQRQAASALQDNPAAFQLLLLSDEDARAAYDLSSGEAHASFQHTILNAADLFGSILQRRAGLLAGASVPGVTVTPLNYSLGGTQGSLPAHVMAADMAGVPVEPFAPANDGRVYGIWASLLGETGDIEADGNAAELDHDSYGLAGGIDGSFDLLSGSAMIGASWGYTHTDASVGARLSDADIESGHVGIYGAWDNDRLRLSGASSFSFHGVDTTRRIIFPGVNRTAEADYDAHTFAFSGEAAYRFAFGSVFVSPLATAKLLLGERDGATETGAGALNLVIASESYEQFDTGLGLAFGTSWAAGPALISAEARLLWQHGFGDDSPSQTLAFTGGGGPFNVIGPERPENWLVVGAGIAAEVTDSVTVTGDYEGSFSGDGTSHQGHISVKYRF